MFSHQYILCLQKQLDWKVPCLLLEYLCILILCVVFSHQSSMRRMVKLGIKFVFFVLFVAFPASVVKWGDWWALKFQFRFYGPISFQHPRVMIIILSSFFVLTNDHSSSGNTWTTRARLCSFGVGPMTLPSLTGYQKRFFHLGICSSSGLVEIGQKHLVLC